MILSAPPGCGRTSHEHHQRHAQHVRQIHALADRPARRVSGWQGVAAHVLDGIRDVLGVSRDGDTYLLTKVFRRKDCARTPLPLCCASLRPELRVKPTNLDDWLDY